MQNYNRIADISVIICCFNSSRRIRDTLSHIINQEISANLTVDVLLIDNASEDHTSDIALSFWDESQAPFPLRVIKEPNPGLVNARICGINNAYGSISIFCDDDNHLFPDYVQNAYDFFSKNKCYSAVGGQTLPRFEDNQDVPNWFKYKSRYFAVGKQFRKSQEVTSNGLLWGAGLCIKTAELRSIYELQPVPLLTGRKGDIQLAGDDSELCIWIILAGHRLYYHEELKLHHKIPKNRLTKNYLNKLISGIKASHPIIRGYLSYCTKENQYFDIKKIIYQLNVAYLAKLVITRILWGNLVVENVKIISSLSKRCTEEVIR